MKISEKHGSRWRLLKSRIAPRRGLTAPRVSLAFRTFPPRQAPVPASAAIFLIANPALEFRVSYSKQSTEAKSNRKKIAISRLSFSAFSGPGLQASNLRNLIVTPRLKFCATRTKQSSFSISNRYKMHFSRLPQSHPCLRILLPFASHATIRAHISR
jgi:hypothetical protein